MADILLNLLDAIEALLETEVSQGGDLSDAKTYFVKRVLTEIPPEYGYPLPFIMVDPLQTTANIVSIPPCMTRKEYPIRFRVFFENNGDTDQQTAAELLDDIEDLFYQELFDLAKTVDLISKNYNAPIVAPYSGPVNGAATLVMQYMYIDVRALPS